MRRGEVEIPLFKYCLSQGTSQDVHLSKALSYILRHGAAKEGLPMSEGKCFLSFLNVALMI